MRDAHLVRIGIVVVMVAPMVPTRMPIMLMRPGEGTANCTIPRLFAVFGYAALVRSSAAHVQLGRSWWVIPKSQEEEGEGRRVAPGTYWSDGTFRFLGFAEGESDACRAGEVGSPGGENVTRMNRMKRMGG
jgi:hypothetical protein